MLNLLEISLASLVEDWTVVLQTEVDGQCCTANLWCCADFVSPSSMPIGGQANFAQFSGISWPFSSINRCLFSAQTPSSCLPAQMTVSLTFPGLLKGNIFLQQMVELCKIFVQEEHPSTKRHSDLLEKILPQE